MRGESTIAPIVNLPAASAEHLFELANQIVPRCGQKRSPVTCGAQPFWHNLYPVESSTRRSLKTQHAETKRSDIRTLKLPLFLQPA